MSDAEDQAAGKEYNHDIDQSMENDEMDELFGEDGDSDVADLPAEYETVPFCHTSPLLS